MLETKIFKPYDKRLDQEEWPQLRLVDAVVYKHVADGPDKICDLLDVHFTKPLRVTGTLVKMPAKFNKIVIDLPVTSQRRDSVKTAAALAKGLGGTTITLTDVHTYAIQSYRNKGEKPTIWALGGAAWYAISPALEYRECFDQSLEKASAWDMVLGLAEGPDSKQLTVEKLFTKYFKKYPSCKSVNGAETIFREFRIFLMVKILDRIDSSPTATARTMWRNFCLSKWLTTEYNGIAKSVQGLLKAGQTDGKLSTDRLTLSLNIQYFFDSLESFVLEGNLELSQFTREWLISFIVRKSGEKTQDAQLLLQEQANYLSTSMIRSRQVNWVQSSLYSDLLLMSGEVPSDGDNDEATVGAPATRVKNGGSGKGEVVATANLIPAEGRSPDALDEVNDMDQDNHSTSACIQPPRSAKGKSVLRPIMTPSVQQKSAEESGISSLPSSPPQSSHSTPVTVEKLVAPGPSTLHKRQLSGSATGSQEPAKRSRVAGGSPEGADSGDADDEDNWPPLIPGRGRPPIVCRKFISMKPDDGGTWWRCKINGCLTILPDAHLASGRVVIQKHIDDHRDTIVRAGHVIHQMPREDHALEFVPPETFYSLVLMCSALLDKIERMAAAWEQAQQENLEGFDELNRSLIELDRQRERERALAGEEGKQEPEEQANASDEEPANGERKGRGGWRGGWRGRGRGGGRGRGRGRGKQ
ncbi:unnamed protein product [Tuber aestivum]|uniref:DNA (cytosine-5)-methyltransferase 1 replication foci domain-containing protein n=1 Tax=Tuber aestivum TaxID=59557 RepID=A0A292PSG1_9PEZI|nr:unnamed protein product [Tuber aestivum]